MAAGLKGWVGVIWLDLAAVLVRVVALICGLIVSVYSYVDSSTLCRIGLRVHATRMHLISASSHDRIDIHSTRIDPHRTWQLDSYSIRLPAGAKVQG